MATSQRIGADDSSRAPPRIKYLYEWRARNALIWLAQYNDLATSAALPLLVRAGFATCASSLTVAAQHAERHWLLGAREHKAARTDIEPRDHELLARLIAAEARR
jgi:hypothetical protein